MSWRCLLQLKVVLARCFLHCWFLRHCGGVRRLHVMAESGSEEQLLSVNIGQTGNVAGWTSVSEVADNYGEREQCRLMQSGIGEWQQCEWGNVECTGHDEKISGKEIMKMTTTATPTPSATKKATEAKEATTADKSASTTWTTRWR